MDFSVVLARTCSNVGGHVAIITETESTYVMIESTLWFDDVADIPGLPLLQAVQRSCTQSRERSGRRLQNEARSNLNMKYYFISVNLLFLRAQEIIRWWGRNRVDSVSLRNIVTAHCHNGYVLWMFRSVKQKVLRGKVWPLIHLLISFVYHIPQLNATLECDRPWLVGLNEKNTAIE